MSKRKERTKINCGIAVSAIGCVIVLFCRLLCSDMAKQPGFLRNIRFVMDTYLGNSFSGLQAWYHENSLASFLVGAISIVPFLLLVLLIIKRYQLFERFRSMDKGRPQRGHSEEPAQVKEKHTPEVRIDSQKESKDHETAMKRLEALQNACGDVNGKDNKFAGDRGVRVQVLSADPKQRMDQLVEWKGSEWEKTAVITLSAQYEIVLKMDDRGVPGIVGASQDEEEKWIEDTYPLEQEETVTIMRQGSQGTVDRCLITWLGGRDQ